jgi:hypothetical protein
MPPPALPARIILGVPGTASPPRTLAGNLLPCPAFLTASNVPAQVGLDQLKQRMGSYAGCLPETLKSRPSSQFGAIEFMVHFTDKDHAVQCANSLIGRPFLDTQPDFGAVIVKVRTQAEVDHAKAMIERNKDRYAAPSSSARGPAPRVPVLTRETFDIGERPTVDVRDVCWFAC